MNTIEKRPSEKSKIIWAIIGFLLFMGISLWMLTDSTKIKEYGNDSNVIAKPIDQYISKVDGSVFEFEYAVKKMLHDPNSFEHVNTDVKSDPLGSFVELEMTFRSKNKLGALVLGKAKGELDLTNGSVNKITIE